MIGNFYYKKIKANRKGMLNPDWSDAKIIHEHSYANMNKKLLHTSELSAKLPYTDKIIERFYDGYFSNGTKVEILEQSYEVLHDGTRVDDYQLITFLNESNFTP